MVWEGRIQRPMALSQVVRLFLPASEQRVCPRIGDSCRSPDGERAQEMLKSCLRKLVQGYPNRSTSCILARAGLRTKLLSPQASRAESPGASVTEFPLPDGERTTRSDRSAIC